MTAPPGRLTVLAGPTAVGKGTIAAYVRTHFPAVWFSVSMTTRRPRPGEVDGVHYHFLGDQEFDRLVVAGQFLEHAVVHGTAKYGTPRGPVERALREGRDALLEIDLQGARQVRETMPEALFVFLEPPSWEELVRRLVVLGVLDASVDAAGELWFPPTQLPAAARVQRLRAGFGVNYASLGLVTELLDRIARLERALRARPGATR